MIAILLYHHSNTKISFKHYDNIPLILDW